MKRQDRINLKIAETSECEEPEDDEVIAYLTLPDHPGSGRGVVKKTVRLRDLAGKYNGPDLSFDFDEHNYLIGVEILD